ncbi:MULTISPECIES: YgjV family protein [Pseudoalteromonas]|uniref:YgjV family protein n=1 Tax=Pseudoalteromonas TaxID=53246 RepID=UPI0003062A95|nr:MULTISPECIES: YgjV family protein [Pseudoalteromonas]MCF6143369.1 hypothetical protein [Pseudoalteromonas mariniglutinosa NCIMB 1770]
MQLFAGDLDIFHRGILLVADAFIAQGFGFLSFLLAMLCFMQKDDRRLKLIMIVMNLNHALHFYLLNAVTSSLCCLFSAARTAVSIKSKATWLACIFVTLTALIGYFTAQQWTEYIAVLGACLGSYALFCLTGITMRWVLLSGSCLWLINNIIVGSIGGVLLEAMVIVINLMTIYRLNEQRSTLKESV